MSDWESDEDNVKQQAAPVQSQRFDQNRGARGGYENSPNRGGYSNNQNRSSTFNHNRGGFSNNQNRSDDQRDRRDYGNSQRDSNQQYDNKRDHRPNYGNGRQNQDRGGGSCGGNELKLLVDNSKLGIIIGRGGSKIREIQETNSVNVRIGALNRANKCFLSNY